MSYRWDVKVAAGSVSALVMVSYRWRCDGGGGGGGVEAVLCAEAVGGGGGSWCKRSKDAEVCRCKSNPLIAIQPPLTARLELHTRVFVVAAWKR